MKNNYIKMGIPPDSIISVSIGYIEEFSQSRGESAENILSKLSDYLCNRNNNDNTSKFNLFPSDKKGRCHKECIALAELSFEEGTNGMKSGFVGVMDYLVKHWWSCFEKTKITVIHVADWNQKAFEENYMHIIGNYERATKNKVIIFELGRNGLIERYPFV